MRGDPQETHTHTHSPKRVRIGAMEFRCEGTAHRATSVFETPTTNTPETRHRNEHWTKRQPTHSQETGTGSCHPLSQAEPTSAIPTPATPAIEMNTQRRFHTTLPACQTSRLLLGRTRGNRGGGEGNRWFLQDDGMERGKFPDGRSRNFLGGQPKVRGGCPHTKSAREQEWSRNTPDRSGSAIKGEGKRVKRCGDRGIGRRRVGAGEGGRIWENRILFI